MAAPFYPAALSDGFWQQMREGLAWFYAHKLGMLNMGSLAVLVLFSQEVLGLNATGHGILLTAGGA